MTLSSDGNTLVGYQDIVPDCSSPGRFHVVMRKDIPLEVMAFYPSPKLLDTNRQKALWMFATSVVLFKVQQRTITWQRIKSRCDNRRRYASLVYLQSSQGKLQPENFEELQRLSDRATLAEVHRCVYAAVEPEKFSWILPPCSGNISGNTCGLLMKTTVPMLHCLSCVPERGYERFGLVFCGDNPDCLGEHLRGGWLGAHCIVKTRVQGWSTGENYAERQRREADLLRLTTATATMLAGFRYDPPVEEPFSPHRLSPITEMSDEAQIEYGQPSSDLAVASNVFNDLSISVVHKEAQHPDLGDVESLADEPTAPTHGSQPIDATFSPGSRSDTTVVDSEVVSAHSLLDSNEDSSVQPVADWRHNCISCNEEVKMPCWLCIDCPGACIPMSVPVQDAVVSYQVHILSGSIFVCLDCDEKGGIAAGDHKDTHTLARIYDNRGDYSSARRSRHHRASGYNADDENYEDEDTDDGNPNDSEWEDSSNSRVDGATESQLIALGGRLTRMEERFGAVETKLGRLESMLETVVSLLRTQPPTQAKDDVWSLGS